MAVRALARVGLSPFKDEPATALSLPSRKRLEVARALATEPRLLLLDEMMSGLSPAETSEAIELVRDLQQSGITVMLVEHVMDVVLPLSSRVVVLDHGGSIAEGTPHSVASNPAVRSAYLGNASHRSRRAIGSACDPTPSRQTQPVLRVDDLHVDYLGAIALAGVSLEVRRGELVALVGSNGAGKTTLLATLAGLKPPTAGTVRFEGRPITGLPAHEIARLGVSLVPEGREVFAGMTVERNLLLGAYGSRDDEVRMARLARVQRLFPILAERASQRAGTLSGGEQQMLAIGRALMADPSLLLLDEPMLGLGPIVVDSIRNSLVQIRESGVAILLVEQHLDEALSLAHRGYVLLRGHIAIEGPAHELLRSEDARRAHFGM
jgi:ABC-type branched-subunit amino acid transport system ATPase component